MNSKSLDIQHRIDRLKAGDWERDSKSDVIETIEKQRETITKKLNPRVKFFRAILILAIASTLGWLAVVYGTDGVLLGLLWTLGVAASILCALPVRYRVRPAALRRALKDVNSYWAEAAELSHQGEHNRGPTGRAGP